jgi:phosphotriesterase-related protein
MKREEIYLVGLGLATILAVIVPAWALGPVIHVDDDAPAGGDGVSWSTAFKHLQDALVPLKARSSDWPLEVRVAQGTYKPDQNDVDPEGSGDRQTAFVITQGVHVVGGYAGVGAVDPNFRDVVAYPTILSGDLAGDDVNVHDPNKLVNEPTRKDNSQHVVVIAGPALMEGVTITSGHAHSWVVQLGDEFGPDAPIGGGAKVMGAGITIRDCIFKANFAASAGGGLAEESFSDPPDADVLLTGCTFDGNVAALYRGFFEGRGGAIMLSGGKAVLRDCMFRGNQAKQGGCVHSTGAAHVEMVNCLAVGNVASKGGAVLYNENGSAKVQNCTATGNTAPEGRFLLDNTARPGRGSLPPSIRVDSCILANDGNEVSNGYAALTIQYTDMAGGRSAVNDPRHAMVWGPGNIDADPCFAEAGYWDANDTPEDANDDLFVPGDYHLKSRAGRWDLAARAWVQDAVTSPCIDAGNPALPFDDEPLPNGNRVNMGVYGGTAEASKSGTKWWLVTTQGSLLAEGLGVILPHEHIFTDLRGPTVAGYGQANPADVVRVMKPWLVAAHDKGVGVLIECTSIGVGRNVPIVDQVARESGLPVVVPTGVYGRDNFAPPEHRNMTEDELTALFIREIREGIDGTGIKAGFIKIATGSSAMTPLEEKFLRAAGRAARETGAAIASHTPVSSNTSRQIAILQSIDPAVRFIWVHAQSENNRDMQRQMAARGVFIEFDSLGSNPGQDSTLIAAIKDLLAAGYGDRILLSHDAGWYQPGSPNGGTQRSYTYLIDTFIPKLRDAGVDDDTIRMITQTNPIRAFAFRSSQ